MSERDDGEVRALMAEIERVRGRPVLIREAAKKPSASAVEPSAPVGGVPTPPEGGKAAGVPPGALLERPTQVPAGFAWFLAAAGFLALGVALAAVILLLTVEGARP